MKLTVKDLAGKKLVVEVEPSLKISELKSKVQEINADYEVSRQKLIHKGKVLKDDDTIESTGVTENDFFVCMIAKPKVTPARAPAPAPAPVSASSSSTANAASSSAATPATTTPSTTATPAPAPSAATATIDPAQVESLVSMGFPEAQVRAALEATGGNPDTAYALLESGAPIQAPAPRAATGTGAAAPTAGSGITSLEAFRAHPQFNELRRLVQSNPGSIDQVLQLIGQQSPQLLQVILQQQDDFIAMMNEPIEEGTAGPGSSSTAGALPNPFAGLGAGGEGALGGLTGEGDGPSPQQLAQILQAMPEQQRNQLLGALVGLPPDQVQQFSGQLIQALASGAPPGMGGGLGGVPPGAQRIELTAEEAANLNQLVEMGFDRNEALQVFLACGKNVEVAASILFEGAESGGPGGATGGSNSDNSGTDSGGDQMY